jgi:hypothetical protein
MPRVLLDHVQVISHSDISSPLRVNSSSSDALACGCRNPVIAVDLVSQKETELAVRLRYQLSLGHCQAGLPCSPS